MSSQSCSLAARGGAAARRGPDRARHCAACRRAPPASRQPPRKSREGSCSRSHASSRALRRQCRGAQCPMAVRRRRRSSRSAAPGSPSRCDGNSPRRRRCADRRRRQRSSKPRYRQLCPQVPRWQARWMTSGRRLYKGGVEARAAALRRVWALMLGGMSLRDDWHGAAKEPCRTARRLPLGPALFSRARRVLRRDCWPCFMVTPSSPCSTRTKKGGWRHSFG